MEIQTREVACSGDGPVNVHDADEWCDICRNHGFEGPFSAVRYKVVNANGEVVAEAPVDGVTGARDIARYMNYMAGMVTDLEAQVEEDERLRAALRERVSDLEAQLEEVCGSVNDLGDFDVTMRPPNDRHSVWSTTVALETSDIHGAVDQGTKIIERVGCDVQCVDVTPINDAEAAITLIGR